MFRRKSLLTPSHNFAEYLGKKDFVSISVSTMYDFLSDDLSILWRILFIEQKTCKTSLRGTCHGVSYKL